MIPAGKNIEEMSSEQKKSTFFKVHFMLANDSQNCLLFNLQYFQRQKDKLMYPKTDIGLITKRSLTKPNNLEI